MTMPSLPLARRQSIERGEIRPLLARVFPLEDIAAAQREFLKKCHAGTFVLVSP